MMLWAAARFLAGIAVGLTVIFYIERALGIYLGVS